MATVDVYSPVKGFSGVSVGGVVFSDGHAVVEEGTPAYQYFKRRGYHLGAHLEGGDGEVQDGDAVIIDDHPDDTDAPPADDDTQDVDIPGMPGKDATRGELAEFAEGMGLDTESLTKVQIVDKIKAEAAK